MTDTPEVGWSSATADQSIDELVSHMSLEEKVAFVTGDLNWNYGFFAEGVEGLGIPDIRMADGPAGVRINRGDVHDGRATQLPAPIALAATWDTSLAEEYGAVVGDECRHTDHNVSLGPAVDIARVPLAGRTFESFGEDPHLAGRTGVAYVKGVQAQGIQACGKHYAVNNQEFQRHGIDVIIDERTLRELYLPPFEALIREGGVASMMGSFNRVNGDFACEKPELLRTILREVFEFRGWIMSDYGANHSTAPSANAGLDQEQPNEGFWGGQLLAAVQAGEVSESTIDEKVRNILRPMIGLGQLENPSSIGEFDVEGHHALAQQVAEAGMVLLRNDGLLPLGGVRSVALIGPDVDSANVQGGGSSQVRATRDTTPLDGLRAALGDDVEITVVHGSDPVTTGALLPGPDAIPSSFFSTPEGKVGLRAEYWTNTDFLGDPFLTRTEGQIELMLGIHNFPGFNASSARWERLPGELNGRISARFTGTLTAPVTGDYVLSMTALGHYVLTLDGQRILSNDSGASVQTLEDSGARVLDLAGPDESWADSTTPSETAPYGWPGGGEKVASVDRITVRLRAGRA